MGGSWCYLHAVGRGVPDGLAGMYGEMELVEIKAEKGRLNERQEAWREGWRGPEPWVVRSVEDLERLRDALKVRAERRAYLRTHEPGADILR